MDDLISRQEAINALNDEITITGASNAYVVRDYVRRVKQKLENIPSDEPEIIHCRECRFGEVDNPCFPDQYFCHHNGCDWNLGDHYCGYAERREKTNEGNH